MWLYTFKTLSICTYMPCFGISFFFNILFYRFEFSFNVSLHHVVVLSYDNIMDPHYISFFLVIMQGYVAQTNISLQSKFAQ